MTQRIARAILLTVWVTLITCGAVVYLATRTVLLEDLDESLVARALTLPQIASPTAQTPAISRVRADDRFTIQFDGNGSRTDSERDSKGLPSLISTIFTLAPDGSRQRTVKLRAMVRPADGAELQPATITFSAPADRFDWLLNRLISALIVTGMVGGASAALIARAVARQTLLPLRTTAEVVASLDQRSLDRRIDENGLPAELLPVVSKLNQLLARLHESISQREQFIADASHELRTPVASLMTGLEVALRRPRQAEEYRNAIETGLTDARLLRRLIDTLLAQVRNKPATAAVPAAANGNGKSNPASVPAYDESADVAQLASECAATIAPLAAARSIQVTLNGPANLFLRTQPDRLRSILLNLMGNAVQYNRDGGKIDVLYRVKGPRAEIEVRDTGVGIAPEHLARIFAPFFRVDQAHPQSGNLGLGLSLVQSHVQALCGECEVQSELGQGTMFVVRLPGIVGLVGPIAPEIHEVISA